MNYQNRDPLTDIGYISISEDIQERIGNFTINPDIMLPIQFPPGAESISTENITWEAIISAMLRLLAYRPDHEHADYFRDFIQAVKPDIKDELTEAGILKAENKDFDVAIEIFMALEGLFTDCTATKLNLALTYEDRAYQYEKLEKTELSDKYLELAFNTYRRALNSEPSNPRVLYNLAHFHLRRNNFDKARIYFKSFLKNGNDPEKLKEAQKIIDEINNSGLLDSLFKEAFDDIKTGREKEGIKKISIFLDKYNDVWNAWFLLGWGYRRLGMYSEGKEAFGKALKLHEPLPDTLNELAICLMELGELDESFKKLQDALEMEPENTKVISNMGIVLLKMGKEDDAMRYFKIVLEIDKGDELAQKYLDMIHR